MFRREFLKIAGAATVATVAPLAPSSLMAQEVPRKFQQDFKSFLEENSTANNSIEYATTIKERLLNIELITPTTEVEEREFESVDKQIDGIDLWKKVGRTTVYESHKFSQPQLGTKSLTMLDKDCDFKLGINSMGMIEFCLAQSGVGSVVSFELDPATGEILRFGVKPEYSQDFDTKIGILPNALDLRNGTSIYTNYNSILVENIQVIRNFVNGVLFAFLQKS